MKDNKNPKYWRNKADAILTPIVKNLYPRCLLCPSPTQVAHHHVHKSKSTRLRYELINLIPLCNKCHFSLHQNESYHASRIVEILGIEWFRELEKIKNEIVKADWVYYKLNYERLEKLLTPQLLHASAIPDTIDRVEIIN